ncbi:hypothetical protein ABN584_10965 [Gloeocapsa sp. BRSZ]
MEISSSEQSIHQDPLKASTTAQGRVAIDASLSKLPTAVVYFYRQRGCADLHAMFFELWELGQKIAIIEPIHCLGLNDTHVRILIGRALKMLSEACCFDLDGFAYSFTLHPLLCPITPCPPENPFIFDKNAEGNLTQEIQLYGLWSHIWFYKQFHASLLATYFCISDQGAIELLQRLQEAGYVEFGKQIGDSLLIRSHTFSIDPQLNSYTSKHQFIGTPSDTSVNQISERLSLQSSNLATTYHYAWTSMRIFGSFSLSQIEASANISKSELEKYVERLHRAGYLQMLRRSTGNYSDDEMLYQLVKDSGRIAPITCDEVIYDLNTNTLYKLPSLQTC